MVSEWRTSTLGDICTRILTGGTPLKSKEEYFRNAQVPWLKTKEVNFCRIYETENHISEIGLRESAAKLVPINSVIVAMYGQGDTAGRVAINKIPLCTNQACCNLVIDEAKADYQYVYYTLKGSYSELVRRKTGSAQPNLNTNIVKTFEIPLPPFPEQKAIAHILGSLDDKIELNRRMNGTLEGMAQALFKSWFVDFDPVIDNALVAGNPLPDELAEGAGWAERVETRRQALATGRANRQAAQAFPAAFQFTEELGWIPAGWRAGSILEQAKLLSGGTPKTSEMDYWNGEIKWTSAKDVSQCGKAFLTETERTITKLGLDKSATRIVPKFTTVIISRGATTGRMTMLGEDMAMNQTCYGLRVNSGHHFYGYSHAVHFISSLVHAAHGSIFDTITTDTFHSSKVILAGIDPIRDFEKTVSPLFTKVLANQYHTTVLTNLRDTLLPKLISGELRIPDAEKLAEEALA